MANSQSNILKIADKKTAYNEGRLYSDRPIDGIFSNIRMTTKIEFVCVCVCVCAN